MFVLALLSLVRISLCAECGNLIKLENPALYYNFSGVGWGFIENYELWDSGAYISFWAGNVIKMDY